MKTTKIKFTDSVIKALKAPASRTATATPSIAA